MHDYPEPPLDKSMAKLVLFIRTVIILFITLVIILVAYYFYDIPNGELQSYNFCIEANKEASKTESRVVHRLCAEKFQKDIKQKNIFEVITTSGTYFQKVKLTKGEAMLHLKESIERTCIKYTDNCPLYGYMLKEFEENIKSNNGSYVSYVRQNDSACYITINNKSKNWYLSMIDNIRIFNSINFLENRLIAPGEKRTILWFKKKNTALKCDQENLEKIQYYGFQRKLKTHLLKYLFFAI